MRVVGLISGTSVDGIDAVLVDVSGTTHDLRVDFLAGETYPYPRELREQILAVCHGQALSLEQMAVLDDAIAHAFADAALKIQDGHQAATLIGSHGQTVFHRPPSSPHTSEDQHSAHPSSLGYSVQWGRGDLIAHLTQTPTVSNFRAADIALGGHGAPLVPAVDAWLLSHSTEYRCMQNIGGIGNVTYLPPHCKLETESDRVLGWDTGPGNALIDHAVKIFSNGAQTYDRDGAWAASGHSCDELIQRWLTDDFFHQPPPKSTGREKFGADYTQRCLADMEPYDLSQADALATLTEFTAASIALNYSQFLDHQPDRVMVAGGGSRNQYLMTRLCHHLPSTHVVTTVEEGINVDYKEAIAFAVLAYWRWHHIPSNVPSVTGAKYAVSLGELHHIPWNSGDAMT
ncbi:MAG: anhydro-N-acetylmuramic acid kinase [Leptolyngbyaceae bacterium]|nr:anhydro-N-acetylmuramic acid kinase [Leptolyngbyaceae bacterium]